MADPGIQLEAWTLPNVGAFTRKFDLTRWVDSFTFTDRWSGLNDGTFRLPDSFHSLASLLTIDETDHTNDEGSIIRLLRNGDPLPTHYVVTRLEDDFTDNPTVTVGCAGMEWFLDRARVHAYDYPADPSTEADWLYGAASVLKTIGGETAVELQEIWRGANVTSGTIVITDGSDSTAPLAWNMSASTLASALEGFAGIDQVTVRGDGSIKTPYEIEFVAPTVYQQLSISVNSTDGDWSVSTTREGGSLSERPWVKSFHPVTGQEHGNYQTFQVVTSPVPPGDTYALQIDPDDVDYPTDYAGAQQYVQVTPGHRYRASIPVYAPTTGRTFRLVIRTMSEDLIATSGDVLVPADTWTTLSTGIFTMPADVTQVIFRVGIIETANIGSVYVGIESASLAPGAEADTLGGILNDLLAPINSRGVLTWLTPTWTDTVDSAGTAWDRTLAWQVKRGQSLLQLLEYAARWGYEWRVRWDSGAGRFEWDVYNPAGGGSDLSASVTVSGRDGGVGSGPIVRRTPDLTHALAEGDLGRWGEYTAATLSGPWGRLEGYFGNKTGRDSAGLASLAQQLTARSLADTSGRRVQLADPSRLPWTDYQPGDTVTVNLAPKDAKQSLRVMQVTVSSAADMATPVYDVHVTSIVLDPESAVVDTVRSLARTFRGLEDVPANDRTLDPAMFAAAGGTGKIPFLVAAADSDPLWRAAASYLCDGVDDQIEIQAALDAAGEADTGGEVVLAPGYYALDFTGAADQNVLTVPTNVALTGISKFYAGPYLVGPNYSTPGSNAALIRLGVGGVLRDLSLASSDSHAVRLKQYAAPVRIEDCYIEATGGSAVIGEDIVYVTIRGCTLIENTGGFDVVDGRGTWQQVWILHNELRYGRHGINLNQTAASDQPGHLLIAGNYLASPGSDGIRVDGSNFGPFRLHIVDNRIVGTAAGLIECAGIHLIGLANPTEGAYSGNTERHGAVVARNIIQDVETGHGIWLDDVDLAVVADNFIQEVDRHGIYLDDGHEVQVADNFVWAAGREADDTFDGVHLAGSDRCYLRANTIRRDLTTGNWQRYGIYVDPACGVDNIVVGNDLRIAGKSGPFAGSAILTYPDNPTYGDNFIGGGGPAYGGELPSSSIVTVSATIPTPKVSTDIVRPAPVTVAATLPTPTRGGSKTVTPATISATATIPTPTQSLGAAPHPNPVTITATIPQAEQ